MQCVLFEKTAMFIFHPHSDRMEIMRKRIGERMLFFARFIWYFIINIGALYVSIHAEGESNIIKNAKYKTNTVKS